MTGSVQTAPPLTGVLLAGGAGQRFGGDKALAQFDGRTLLERGLAVLGDCCRQVLVASGDGRRLAQALGASAPDTPAVEIADERRGAGPLAGIVAGLAAAVHPLVAVLAVDLVFADAGVFRALADACGRGHAAVAVVGGRPQPLHAIYARSALPPLREALASGAYGVLAALERLDVTWAEASVWGRADPEGRFATNVNTSAELEAARGAGPGRP